MKLLDLFCGRWGWSRAFAARGWECVGVDLVEPPETPSGCEFVQDDILEWTAKIIKVCRFDFIVASSPCEQFSVHGMKHFHPNPPYPELGIKLFNYTRELCETSGILYVMENVRSAEAFVGESIQNCWPFHLWGNATPPLVNRGILKGALHMSTDKVKRLRKNLPYSRKEQAAHLAIIPPELANCVADYVERIIEQRSAK